MPRLFCPVLPALPSSMVTGAAPTRKKTGGRVRNDISCAENWSSVSRHPYLLRTFIISVTGKNEGARGVPGKPVLGVFMRAEGAPVTLAPIPAYTFPESAALALARVTSYGRWRQRPLDAPPALNGFDREPIRRIVERVLGRGGGWATSDRRSSRGALGRRHRHRGVAGGDDPGGCAGGGIRGRLPGGTEGAGTNVVAQDGTPRRLPECAGRGGIAVLPTRTSRRASGAR